MPDLVAHITDAATAAILNERSSLEHPVGKVAGVTIELMLTGAGQVSEAHVYVERRTAGGALLKRYTGKEPSA